MENRTLRERVYELLREDILSGQLGPGAELSEVALAERLGVSRGPIREALGLLCAQGLVTMQPRRGAYVSVLTRQEFLEAYQVREALEALAARLACRAARTTTTSPSSRRCTRRCARRSATGRCSASSTPTSAST